MIVDSEVEYTKFLGENRLDDLIVECVRKDSDIHPATNNPSFILVKNTQTADVYCIGIDHPDFLFTVDKNTIESDFNTLQGKLWVFDKKKFSHTFRLKNVYDIHILEFLQSGKITNCDDLSTVAHEFFHRRRVENKNCVIPLMAHLEKFESLSDIVLFKIRTFKLTDDFEIMNGRVSDSFYHIEKNGLKVNQEVFGKFFGDKTEQIVSGYVYTQYNLFTSTGRPSNKFGGLNYSALKKDDGCRAFIISRHGEDGTLFMMDYSAYHPHLIARLINYPLPMNAYDYLGQQYFGKSSISVDELAESKNMTFQFMYGIVPVEYLKIPYFSKMQEYIKHRWEYFIEYGYVETPIFKRRISKHNIPDASPNKLFNYILQAVETEYNVEVLENINSYLIGKKTKAILYIYDSILFDVHRDDGIDTLRDLRAIMTMHRFPVKCYSGPNFNEMKRIIIN